jgi:soluble lytic murein transglycosylase
VQLATTYPSAGEAAPALDTLADLNQYYAVPPYYRGRILYQSGREDEAAQAFAKTFDGTASASEEAAAGYYGALAIRDSGDKQGAMDELAWLASNYPNSSLAVEALWQRARIAEAVLTTAGARDAYVRLADAYPSNARAGQALSRAAVISLEAGDAASARMLWRRLSVDGPDSSSRADGLFLLGRSMVRGGDPTGGKDLLQQARDMAPLSFAGLRARDALTLGLGSEPYLADGKIALGTSSIDDLASCTTWVTDWSGQQSFAPADRLVTVDRLLAVGLRAAADAEGLEMIRGAAPGRLLGSAQAFADRRMYPLSMLAATRLASASPTRTVDGSPDCLQRFAYPLAFPELVEAQASANGLNPALMMSLLRQESWFSPNARSGAPALGLSQVIPQTATEIANKIGRPGFRWEELGRPTEAVTFGTWYLADQTRQLGRRPLLATAAYNAGAGNAQRWTAGSMAVDPDDFVYSIDFAETRSYVRSIYEHYAHYRALYR